MKEIVEDTQEKYRYMNLLLSVLLMIIYGTVYSWGVFRLPIEMQFSIGTTLSGLPYMTFLMVYAGSMLIGGKLIGKYEPRLLLLLGGFLISLGWILSYFTHNIVQLTFTYGVLIGFGVGISYGVPIYILAYWFPNKKGIIVGIALSGFGLSPLFTAPLGHWFIDNYGLNKTFLYYGVIFGILILLLTMLIRMPQGNKFSKKSKNVSSDETVSMIKVKSFRYAYICFFLGTFIGLTIIGLTSNVGKEVFGLSSKDIATLMIIFSLFNGVGRPIFGGITEKYGPRFAMRISYTFIIIASIGMLFASKGMTIVYVLIFSILWLNLGAWLAIAPIMTMKLYGMKTYSENYGIMFTAYGFGAVFGVSSTGLLIDLMKNYNLIFSLIIVLALGGMLLSGKVEPPIKEV